jgi:excinuclease UvrABC ATPase subunit
MAGFDAFNALRPTAAEMQEKGYTRQAIDEMAHAQQEDRCVAKTTEPKPWTHLERAADRLKSAQDDMERWTSALNTVKTAWMAARQEMDKAKVNLEKTALSETPNLPE